MAAQAILGYGIYFLLIIGSDVFGLEVGFSKGGGMPRSELAIRMANHAEGSRIFLPPQEICPFTHYFIVAMNIMTSRTGQITGPGQRHIPGYKKIPGFEVHRMHKSAFHDIGVAVKTDRRSKGFGYRSIAAVAENTLAFFKIMGVWHQ